MTARTFIIVPAAGGGQRMQQSLPKQYLSLRDRPILEHTLATLLQVPNVECIVVAIAANDNRFDALPSAHHPRLRRALGQATRAESVLSALASLASCAEPDDWVLVHDAARPLVRLSDIAKLVECLHNHPVGGLLATPVTDTLKQVDAHLSICRTVAREALWRAQTPQMCRYGLLKHALSHCLQHGIEATDEAMALEMCGHRLQVIEGSHDNVKITYPIDLAIAEHLLSLTH